MKENGILANYYEVCVEQIKVGRYHVPETKLHMKKKNGKWVQID
jgi:lambda repressor-like predicted transcriptional regulator